MERVEEQDKEQIAEQVQQVLVLEEDWRTGGRGRSNLVDFGHLSLRTWG